MMSGIRGANTQPELFVRHAIHARGFRYRLGGANLPGRPDLVFPRLKTVVLIHGCFWHRHTCSYFKWPQSNIEFWRQKLERNADRDVRTKKLLAQQGWRVLIVWECELRKTNYKLPNPAVDRVCRVLEKLRSS